MTQLPRIVFRYVEHMLYNLEAYRDRYKQLREEIICSSGSGGEMIKGGALSDQVGRKVAQLLDNRGLGILEERIRLLDDVIQSRNQFKKLYEHKYCQGLGWKTFCARLKWSETQFRRARKALVCEVAKRMGEI